MSRERMYSCTSIVSLAEPGAAITFGNEATVLDWAEDDERVLHVAPDAVEKTRRALASAERRMLLDAALARRRL